AARDEYEEKIRKAAFDQVPAPPPSVKVKIFEALGISSPTTPSSNSPKIITMEKTTSSTKGWLRFTAAASIILLAGMVWMYNRSNTLDRENRDLADINNALRARANS